MPARCVIVLLMAGALGWSQRHKPIIDPETKEGYLIQVIQQERNPAQKVKLLKEFAAEFPASPSLGWVFDQLQPVYLEGKEFDKVVEMGARVLERHPDDLESAHGILIAAEGLGEPDQLQKAAVTCWQIGSKLAKAAGYNNPDYARQVVAYAEYSIAKLANETADKNKRHEYLKSLEKLNARSAWLHAAPQEAYTLSAQGADVAKLALAAENSLKTDPNNEDMLMVVADYHMQRGDNPEKVFDYATRTLEILRTKTAPSGVSPEAWEEKKDRFTAAANYMVGIIASIRGRYQQADKSLRAALPVLKANEQVRGAIFYHLAYANYQLAEKGERGRVFEALKFNELCGKLQSSYRDQAVKNIESIRAEYNLR